MRPPHGTRARVLCGPGPCRRPTNPVDPEPKWTLAALLVCLCAVGCETYDFGVDVGAARMALNGDVALGPSGGGVDLSTIPNGIGSSLGLDDSTGAPYIRVSAGHERTSAAIATLWFNRNSGGTLGNDYGDLAQGSPVATAADILAVKTAVYYDVVRDSSNAGSFRLSPGVGIEFLDYDISASSAGLGQSIADWVPMPMVYLRAEGTAGAFRGRFEIGGSSIDLLGVDATLIDLDAMVTWEPLPLIQLFAGYRAILFDW